MSIKLMHQVWTLKLTPSEATVLAHLADHANDDGLSYPSVGLIAWKSNLGERTVQMALRSLQNRQLIQPLGNAAGGRAKTTRYRLHLDRGELKPPFREADDDDAAADTNCQVDRGSKTPLKGAAVAPFGRNGAAAAPFKGLKGAAAAPFVALKGADNVVKGAAAAPEPSLTKNVKEDRPKERGENGNAERRTPSLVPNPFPLTEEMRRQAESYGVAADRIDFETEKFVDKFTEKAERKSDWLAAWRNWMRRVQDFGPRPPVNGVGSKPLESAVGRSALGGPGVVRRADGRKQRELIGR